MSSGVLWGVLKGRVEECVKGGQGACSGKCQAAFDGIRYLGRWPFPSGIDLNLPWARICSSP